MALLHHEYFRCGLESDSNRYGEMEKCRTLRFAGPTRSQGLFIMIRRQPYNTLFISIRWQSVKGGGGLSQPRVHQVLREGMGGARKSR